MKFQNKYRIESTRLKYWDYANPGMYFVTICTKNFVEWFGKIEKGIMILNKLGDVAHNYWEGIPEHFDHVELDEFVIMPNHIHGIICITDVETRRKQTKTNVDVEAGHAVSLHPEHKNKFGPLKKGSLSAIIGSYKSAVTRSIRKNHNPKFAWQTRFYDHVIRNKNALENIQNYIRQNPANYQKTKNPTHEDSSFIKQNKN